MAYEGLIKGNAAGPFALKQKAFSPKLYEFPADTNAKSVEQLPEQHALWAIYLMIQAALQNTAEPLTERFTRYVSNVYLRQGFLHQEAGETVAQIVKESEIPEPGKDITYKMFPYVRMYAESTEEEAVHVRAAYNDYEHRNAGKIVDIEVWTQMRERSVEYLSNAVKNFMDLFVRSILLTGVPSTLISDTLLLYMWGKDMQPQDDHSKEAKKLLDENGEFKKLTKKAAGIFKANFKNILYFDPAYDNLWDSEWKDNIAIPGKPTKESAAADGDINTILQARYIQKDGANKNNPPKGLNRITCIYSLIGVLTTTLIRMLNTKSAQNCMEFDRNATVQASGLQFMCRGEKEHLILIMNPEDLADCRSGAGVTGPTGTSSRSFEVVENMVSKVYALDGMLPGEAYILDDRVINIFPFFSEVLEHKNVMYLVSQIFLHFKFKWGIFSKFCATKVIATRWHAGSYFYSRFLPDFKAA